MTPARRTCCLTLLACALLAARGAAGAAGDAYLPLGEDARWEYEIHRDHTYQPVGGKIDRTFRAGTAVLEHLRTSESGGEFLHELRERREEMSTGPGLPPSREESRQIWSTSRGVRLHALQPLGSAAFRFEPPLQMLPPEPEATPRWHVGTWRDASTAAPLDAETVAAATDDAGARRCEGCIEVRYTGSVSGSVPIAAGSAQIRDARFERVVWWQSGVGMVREVTTTDGELELPDGERARVHEVTTLRLVRHTAPR